MSLQDDVLVPSSDSFWEVDCFKHTVKRTEDGMQMCTELMKFIQERSDIEKEYAKRLKAWVKKWNESFEKGPEYGTTKATLKGALEEADRIADVHLVVKDRLINEVQTQIKDWKNDSYKKQMVGGCKEAKTFEDDFRKAQKPWSKRLTKVLKCKKDYHMACKLEKTATNQENNARNSSDLSGDQVKKIQEKLEKSRKDVKTSKESYEQSLTELNAYNAKYVEDMTEVFNRTQKFEELRLVFIKKILFDMHSCLDLSQNRDVPAIYTQMKETIGQADASKDLKFWSQYHGVEMPMAWPVFEEYSTEFHSISRKGQGRGYVSGISDGVTLTAIQKNDNIGVAVSSTPGSTRSSTQERSNSSGDSHQTSSLHSALVQNSSQNPFGDEEWEEYENTALQDDSDGGVPVRAVYSYDGQEGDELSFKAGDVFVKIKDRDDQGWCTGRKDGHVGLYPDNYVELIRH